MTYDATDLTTYENGGVFIATNIMRTEQARGRCAGTHGDEVCVPGAMDCEEGALSRSGRQTGACVPFGFAGEHRCEVSGWCPAEPEEDVIDPLEGVGNFTIFLRTNVKFPGCEMRTVATWRPRMRTARSRPRDGTFSPSTRFSPGGCGVRRRRRHGGGRADEHLLRLRSRQGNRGVRTEGAVRSYSCGHGKLVAVSRVQRPMAQRRESAWTPSAGMTRDPGGETRALVKAAGPRIRVQITGQGRRFDLGRMTTTLGAGLALVGLATAVVDALLLYVLPLRQTYAALKYTVYGSDEEDRDRSEIEPLVSNEDER